MPEDSWLLFKDASEVPISANHTAVSKRAINAEKHAATGPGIPRGLR